MRWRRRFPRMGREWLGGGSERSPSVPPSTRSVCGLVSLCIVTIPLENPCVVIVRSAGDGHARGGSAVSGNRACAHRRGRHVPHGHPPCWLLLHFVLQQGNLGQRRMHGERMVITDER